MGEKNLDILASGNTPVKRLFFNCFSLCRKKHPGFVTMEFAYAERGEAIDSFYCVALESDIDSWKENFVQFAAKLAESQKDNRLPQFPAYVRHQQVDSCDIMGLARHGVLAEITIHSFAWKAALDLQKQNEKVIADFIAHLRCPSHLLKHLIFSLYAAETENKRD